MWMYSSCIGMAMAQPPPTLLLLIEMDWGKASLSALSLLTHTNMINTYATLVYVLYISICFLLSFCCVFFNLISFCKTLICNLLSCCLRKDILHISNQICSDWAEMIWLDGMSIAGPAVRLKSFCLIHSLSDLQVEQSTTSSWVAFRRPQYEAFKREIWGLLILRDTLKGLGGTVSSSAEKHVSLLASCYLCRQVESMSQQAATIWYGWPTCERVPCRKRSLANISV